MKKPEIFLLILLFIPAFAFSQVSINSSGSAPDPSAMLDINASDKGMLIPRVSLVSIENGTYPVNNPATGLMVFNIGGDLTTGLYIWNGARWGSMATMEQVMENILENGGSGIYGEMYEFNPIGSYSNINITSGGGYVPWTTAVAGNTNGIGFDASTLDAPVFGRYSVSFNAAIQLPGGGKIDDVALFVNETLQDNLCGRMWFKEGGKSQNISFSGIVELDEYDEVNIRFAQNSAGTVHVEIANLSLVKIN
ncbi:MAG: hypothetical protein K0B08_09485 [Bacteroidales bacterium]|nr:hypothetical protein [Bacteroidales bacterium]